MLSKLFLICLLCSSISFAAVSPYSTIQGKVVGFDEKRVKLQVGTKSLYVARSTVSDKDLKVGMEVTSISKTNIKSKKK